MVAHSVDYWWIWPLLTIVAFLIVVWHKEIVKAIRKHKENLEICGSVVGLILALVFCTWLMIMLNPRPIEPNPNFVASPSHAFGYDTVFFILALILEVVVFIGWWRRKR